MRSTGWSAATAMWGIRESIRRSTAAGSPPSRGAKRCPERKRKKVKNRRLRKRHLRYCLELNPAFCDSDDAKYGNLHRNLKWARSSTIGHGAPCCDFRIIDVSRRPDYD
ncbi:MAG: L-2-amino-thiazoline-4-carboxylic acid hydrolase, partial [Clostridia bacterium]|nr:L-2-amino-thiazoline-4-carboxylic acid hydrolase [Clostridia bacterium]